MKTFVPVEEDIKRDWVLVDAAGKPLGRLAVTLANLLRGRHKPTYTPYVDTGVFVVVVNAEKVALSGKKDEMKVYKRYTGYRDGLKLTPVAAVRANHPERILEAAVKGMLPRNTLARDMFKRLKVYAGGTHPHEAQAPKAM
ncbi:MAG: 50S ribosomal protein L13 [Kiritimatiellia bacterium]